MAKWVPYLYKNQFPTGGSGANKNVWPPLVGETGIIVQFIMLQSNG